MAPSKSAFNFRAAFIQLCNELQIDFTPQCPADSECYTGPGYAPRTLKPADQGTIETEDVRAAFSLMLNTIKTLEDRIAVLEGTKPAPEETTDVIEA